MLLPLLFAACTDAEPVDSATPPAEEDEEIYAPTCDSLELHVNGNDPPAVGDAWTVFMWCDDTLLTGVMRMSIDPPEAAEITDNNATFTLPGDAVLTLQVGSRRESRDVTVLDGPS